MNSWWQQRAPRERLFVGVGALLSLLALAWALVWQPMTRQQAALESRLATQHKTMARLSEAQSLRRTQTGAPAGNSSPSPAGRNESLPVMVDRGLRMGGLAAAIRSIQPVGEKQLTVTLQQAPFDLLVAWLEQTGKQQDIFVVEASMDRASSQGSVNARLTVQTNDQSSPYSQD